MRKVIASVVLLSAPVIGCSSQSEEASESPPSTSTTTASTTSTTTTTTTTTTTPQQGAATTYFFAIGDSSVKGAEINARYVDPSTGNLRPGTYRDFYREQAENGQAFVQRLSAASFPPQYQAAVNDVIAKNSVRVSLFFQVANTEEADLPTDIVSQVETAARNSDQAVSALRGLLGLPIER